MADAVDNITLAVANALYRGTITAAGDMADEAPKGYTLQLSRGIRALKPVLRDGEVVGLVISEARSREGYNYAIIQHEAKLRHITTQPLKETFGNTEKEYKVNYARRVAEEKSGGAQLPKYETQYMVRGYENRRDQIIRQITDAVRRA